MKKILAIGIISGVVLFVFTSSLAKQLEGKRPKEKKPDDLAEKNKTEGYFYHQAEQDIETDLQRI